VRAFFIFLAACCLLIGCFGPPFVDVLGGDDDTTPATDDDDTTPAGDDDDDTTPSDDDDDDDSTPSDDDDTTPSDDDDDDDDTTPPAVDCQVTPHPFTTMRANAAMTGFNEGSFPSSPDVAWTVWLGPGETMVRAVVDDRVLASAGGGSELVALDKCTGVELWRTTTTLRHLAVTDGVVITCDESDPVRGLDLQTGAELWTFGSGRNSVNAADGVVYVTGYSSGTLSALDALSGVTLWSVWPINGTSAPCALHDGVVYQNHWSPGQIDAYDAATGALLWSTPTVGESPNTPAYEAGILFGGDTFGTLFALDPDDGTILWTTNVGQDVYARGAAHGIVFATSHNGRAYAYDGATGTQLWVLDPGAGVMPNIPSSADGAVLIGDNQGLFSALDVYTGQLLWDYPGGTRSAIVDGHVFAGNSNGDVFALGEPF